jgi:predicted small integral membrane protein
MPPGFAGMIGANPAAMLILRLCKAALVGAVGLFFFVVALDNLTDYGSNFQFVQHVLSMDDTFPGNAEMWRALHYPFIYHIFYISIILTESTCATLCCYGAYRLFKASQASPRVFYGAKIAATVGITISLLLWLVAFLIVGGEWFLMWQSPHWNGQSSAFRMFGIDALVLVFLWQDETPPPADRP